MLNGKYLATLAAFAAMAVGGVAKAESVSPASAADQLTLSQPLNLQAAPAPALTPLMQGLDLLGLAKPLQDANITIGGYASASLTFYLDRSSQKAQPGRSFDAEDQDPTLNQIGLFVDRPVDTTKGEWDVGGRMEWIYGADARFTHSPDLLSYAGHPVENQFDLLQLYVDVAIPVGNGLRFRGGKFLTPAGLEVINPSGNLFYSRGLLFNYILPFTHTGFVLTYSFTDQLAVDFGLVRGWEDSLDDKNDGLTFLYRLSYTFADKKTAFYATGINGPEYAGDSTHYRNLWDFILTSKLSDEVSVAVQADVLWETSKFDINVGTAGQPDAFAYGIGAWASYAFSQYVQLNGRLEFFSDGQGIRVTPGLSNNLYSASVGFIFTPFPTDPIGANWKLRPEFRYDYSQESIFGGGNNQASFALETYFTF